MNDNHPTFLYAMPFSETEIFFEETSLVRGSSSTNTPLTLNVLLLLLLLLLLLVLLLLLLLRVCTRLYALENKPSTNVVLQRSVSTRVCISIYREGIKSCFDVGSSARVERPSREVERPGLEFDDLKVKLQQRLESLNVKAGRCRLTLSNPS